MIKVMAGDHVDILGKSYYLNTTAITNTNSTTLTALALMTDMLLAPANAAAAKGITASQLNTINSSLIPSSFFRGSNSEPTTTVPKAYINYIFLDENFKYAGGGASRVGVSGSVKDHWTSDAQLQNITVPKNGYIFVYVSNESNFDVFFDNLQVIHKPGPILEETHYYPFGLTIAGISSKAALGLENKYRWNKGSELQNKEFSDGSGLELYETNYRSLDPQIGRFWQIDPIDGLTQNGSLYAYSENNPISFTDALGLYKDSIRMSNGELAYANQPWLDAVVITKKKNFNWLGWPNNINTKNIKIWDYDKNLAIRRQENGELLIQGGESENYLKKVDWYKQLYKSDQDYRTMSLVSVSILMSPILIETTPELISAIQEQSAFINSSIREFGIDAHFQLNSVAEKLISSSIRGLIKTLPVSISTAKFLLNLSSKPLDIATAKNLYGILKFVLEKEGYKGLPESSDLFPEVNFSKK